jgi:hypothetical protein
MAVCEPFAPERDRRIIAAAGFGVGPAPQDAALLLVRHLDVGSLGYAVRLPSRTTLQSGA